MLSSWGNPLDPWGEQGHPTALRVSNTWDLQSEAWLSLYGIHPKFQIVSFSGISLIFAPSESSRSLAETHFENWICERQPSPAPQVLASKWVSWGAQTLAVFCLSSRVCIQICLSDHLLLARASPSFLVLFPQLLQLSLFPKCLSTFKIKKKNPF